MRGKIHEHPNANTNGFDKRPENINRNGRPLSVKKQLHDILEANGEWRIDAENVISINDDGSVTVQVPTEKQIALKLGEWALSNKGVYSLKAIQMIMEQIDGKATQRHDITTNGKDLTKITGINVI